MGTPSVMSLARWATACLRSISEIWCRRFHACLYCLASDLLNAHKLVGPHPLPLAIHSIQIKYRLTFTLRGVDSNCRGRNRSARSVNLIAETEEGPLRRISQDGYRFSLDFQVVLITNTGFGRKTHSFCEIFGYKGMSPTRYRRPAGCPPAQERSHITRGRRSELTNWHGFVVSECTTSA